MRGSFRRDIAALLLLPAVLACDPPHAESPPIDGGSTPMDAGGGPDGATSPLPDAAPSDPDGGVAPDAMVPSYGLDKRPENPTCLAPPKPGMTGLGAKRVFTALKFDHPVGLYQAPGDDLHFYVIEQSTGKVRRFENRADVKPGDVTDMLTLKVLAPEYEGDEVGLLGFAFDPDFADNGHVYVFFNPKNGNLRSTIERYTLGSDGTHFEPGTRRVVLEVPQPYRNHKGGHIAFGQDKHLYIGLGDGGGGDDQHCFALDPQIALGKFLRIDVRAGTAEKPYAIPSDNPYAQGGGLPEIYAIGVRNPWRWSFDRSTGALWAGDVGQGEFEEIDVIERGKSYGWKAKEGKSCFAERACYASELFPDRKIPKLPSCNDPSFVDPVWDYGRDEGAVITGGYVYRGAQHASLVGKYVYGDFTNGRIWALMRTGSTVDNRLITDTDLSISAFGEDNHGELYAVDWQAGGLYGLVAEASSGESGLPLRLSDTGCVDTGAPEKVLSGLIPYDVRVPFWSDGAEKKRWFAIPDGTTLALSEDGDIELPPGGVAMKQFTLAGKKVETRFYVRYQDGSYGGYTYRWADDESDATLLSDKLSTTIDGEPWYFPSQAECESCHHAVSAGHLGLELAQLDDDMTYPSGARANQLKTLEHIGMLTLPEALPTPLARSDDPSAPLEARARSYLHANCAHCHKPGGPGRGAMDMRFTASDPKLCYQAPLEGDLGIPGSFIVSPGEVDKSLLHVRMSRRDDKGMPPLASSKVDDKGKTLLSDWINRLESCD